MTTRVFQADDLEVAAGIIKSGGLVVFPTETVYGLGANAFRGEAAGKIFQAKGRPADNPLIVHAADWGTVESVVREVTASARLLMEAFWPGPLTLVLERSGLIPDSVTAGLETVGIRWPKSPLAQDFLRSCGVPVAAPSANRSGRPSPTTFAMALEAMDGRVDGILGGPDCEVGLESTVVGFPGGRPALFRSGSVTAEALAAVLACDPSDLAPPASVRPLSPGTSHPHYRPLAQVRLFETPEDLRRASEGDWALGPPEFLEAFPGTRQPLPDLETYARRLFALYAEADRAGAAIVWCWLPPPSGLGLALRDRLIRSAGKA